MGKLLRVGEIARESGKTVRAIHLYEEMGLIRCTERTSAGYRLFDGVVLDRLSWIADLQEMGMSLTEIKKVVSHLEDSDSGTRANSQVKEIYARKLGDVRETIHSLRRLESELVHSIECLDVCGTCGGSAEKQTTCSECIADRGGRENSLLSGMHADPTLSGGNDRNHLTIHPGGAGTEPEAGPKGEAG